MSETILDGQQRVVVTSIREDSPANGLVHVGDVITNAAGHPAVSLNSVIRKIRDNSKHRNVTLIIERLPHPFNPIANSNTATTIRPINMRIYDISTYSNSTNVGTLNNHLSQSNGCLLYTSPSPRDQRGSRMPSSA